MILAMRVSVVGKIEAVLEQIEESLSVDRCKKAKASSRYVYTTPESLTTYLMAHPEQEVHCHEIRPCVMELIDNPITAIHQQLARNGHYIRLKKPIS